MAYKPQGLAVVEGGTSLKTLTAHALYVGNGTSAPTALAVGATGQTVLGQTGTDPIWGALPTSPASGVSNLGITYAAGTFTVCSASTAALSAANPAYVVLQGKTPGVVKTIPVTANQTFTDGAAGTTATARFGLVAAVNWATDLPWFLYAVINDAENAIAFMTSRNPAATVSPAAAGISKTGAIVNVDQTDFFALGNPTVTDYDGNPCLCIGSFRTQFVGATNSWTVSALGANDGIGQFNEETFFTMPTGVNGSKAGVYFQSTAGTEPAFATNNVLYKINRTGQVYFNANFNTVNNIPAGAQTSSLTLPYAHAGIGGIFGAAAANYTVNATGIHYVIGNTINSATSYITAFFFNSFPAIFQNATYGVSDDFGVKAIYQAY